MATAAQITANQQNAALSTGPKTPEGKAAAARNSIKHGLSGVFTVLPHENAEDFNQLAGRLRDEFQPDGENENFLVDQMIQSRCRLLRIQRLETLAFEQILTEPGSGTDPDGRIVAAICGSGNALDKLQRYAAAAERSYYKALHELQNSRAKKQRSESAAVENMIKQFVFAPLPGFKPRTGNAPVQNEANFGTASGAARAPNAA